MGLAGEFCLSIVELLTTISFQVGSYWHLSIEAIGRYPVRWLFHTYELVQKARYQKEIAHVHTIELGHLRALIRFHSKRHSRMPKLPSYEESVAIEEKTTRPVKARQPAWMIKYEEVNKDRLARKQPSKEDEHQ